MTAEIAEPGEPSRENEVVFRDDLNDPETLQFRLPAEVAIESAVTATAGYFGGVSREDILGARSRERRMAKLLLFHLISHFEAGPGVLAAELGYEEPKVLRAIDESYDLVEGDTRAQERFELIQTKFKLLIRTWQRAAEVTAEPPTQVTTESAPVETAEPPAISEEDKDLIRRVRQKDVGALDALHTKYDPVIEAAIEDVRVGLGKDTLPASVDDDASELFMGLLLRLDLTLPHTFETVLKHVMKTVLAQRLQGRG